MSGVAVLDTVLLPDDLVTSWLATWRTDYLPGARQRGLRLEQTWQAHAGPDATAVHILWSLPGPYDFFAMRAAAAADPAVVRFWADTDHLAIRRNRQTLQPTPAGAPR